MAIEDADLRRLAATQSSLGRPVTAADLTGTPAPEAAEVSAAPEVAVEAAPPAPKRRGRPPKAPGQS